MMADCTIRLTAHTAMLRRADGLLAGALVRWSAPSGALFAECWYWLNRSTDTLEELVPYRPGTLGDGQG